MISLLQEKKACKEPLLLSQSPTFKRMVQRGLKEVSEGKVKQWKEIWDEL
jgi:hypothetical protein